MPDSWREKYAIIQSLLLHDHKMVANGAVYPRWIEDSNNFWYERQTATGVEYRIVEAKSGNNRHARRPCSKLAIREIHDTTSMGKVHCAILGSSWAMHFC